MALLLALATLGWVAIAVRGFQTRLALPSLKTIQDPGAELPSLTVVVAARDEAANIEQAMRSLLAQDYPGLALVVVDDRSTDGTGEILDGLASSETRMKVVHVSRLPEGWLGKNHANHVAGSAARSAWILFTDGDVVFEPDAVRRAVSYAQAQGLAHLVVAPRMVAHGFMERAFVSAFGLFATALFRAWELRRAGTRGFMGVGAFNLVRRDAYETVGGHTRLALEVLDDALNNGILTDLGITLFVRVDTKINLKLSYLFFILMNLRDYGHFKSVRDYLDIVRFYLPVVFPKLFRIAPKGDKPLAIAFETASPIRV
jgi:cellulose synthase/poly-beta-1,6-N-acetylglucosamine synthase-like glycosyltransferase